MASSTIMSSRRHGHSASIPIPLANMDYTTMGPNLFSTEEAERISSMIDEELKKEYARKKEARKKEVNVMLLGQAESGKSTLQKQFQLYYASQSLEHERPSWRPVVYFNIIKAVRMILDELDYQFLLASQGEPRIDPALVAQDVQDEIAALRGRLLPLVAMEDSLATELSGGVSIAGGRAGAFVRSGWQALVSSTSTSASASSAWSPSAPATVKLNEVASLAAKTLASLTKDVDALWKHRAVKSLLELRKLRLDESAPFFLDSLWRICEAGYLPTTGSFRLALTSSAP
ncbi:hypothetical protein AX16_005996 [Volvariella volvacea WC 439]|nr:hypothetical protein AX16_005996 [Volvariella volvacea WC 439]